MCPKLRMPSSCGVKEPHQGPRSRRVVCPEAQHGGSQATKRTGWIRKGVDGPESIADHMVRADDALQHECGGAASTLDASLVRQAPTLPPPSGCCRLVPRPYVVAYVLTTAVSTNICIASAIPCLLHSLRLRTLHTPSVAHGRGARTDSQRACGLNVDQYRMSIMALVASNDERLDQSKCVQMALAHDMAEAVVGDITPHDGVSKVSIRAPF